MPLVAALQDTAENLFRGEPIQRLAPSWSGIEEDVSTAVSFRELLAARRGWIEDFAGRHRASLQIIASAFSELVGSLPEHLFCDTLGSSFEVPLIDFVDNPARVIERLIAIPYEPEALRFSLFDPLRRAIEANLLSASGMSAADAVSERPPRIVMPSSQRGKSGAELARAYLAGTPFEALVELPVPFSIPDPARFEHCHIVGGTGHGKTQLMQQMIYADLRAAQHERRSVVVIDSQGDLISKLVRLDLFAKDAPQSLADRLILIDPADVEYPASLNLFDTKRERLTAYPLADRERVLNGVVELYELFFGAFLGAELTQKQGVIFKYLARLMLAIPNATIHTLMDIMEDGKKYRPFMETLDGSARHFFSKEFFDPSFVATKKQILKRLWGVLSTPAFERLLAQPTNKVDLFEAMNGGKIIFVNTAKDLLKTEGSALLGRFFIAMITQAALERSTIPERERTPTFVYVDEAHEYFDDSIDTILNQGRKYRVGLTLAHQSLDQLSARLRSTLLANTSIKCVGGVSAKDANALADELRTTEDFIGSMRRHGTRSEFGVWVKHLTPRAIRVAIPLGFVERQPTLEDEEFDVLLAANRARYCGTLADVSSQFKETSHVEALPDTEARATGERLIIPVEPSPPNRATPSAPPAVLMRDLGKGGRKHRYLQALVKELAEELGLKATIEAPLPDGGAVDVLIERNEILAGIEISVSTPVEQERANLRKCLAANLPRIGVVLAKSKATLTHYRAALGEVLSDHDRPRVSFLTPEDIPEYLESLTPAPAIQERVVKGYRVKGSVGTLSREEMKARREAIGRLVARSLQSRNE